jgi:hypothetical protein
MLGDVLFCGLSEPVVSTEPNRHLSSFNCSSVAITATWPEDECRVLGSIRASCGIVADSCFLFICSTWKILYWNVLLSP